jgi:transposase
MLTNLLLPWLSGFRLDTIMATDHHIALELTAMQAEASCPLCGQFSRAIHSHYDRTVADLPWASTPVRLSIHVRKFFCRNPACPRVVFTERLPALLAPSARRTQRLGTEQRQLALDQGGEAGARTATPQGMPVSPRTRCGLLAAHPRLSTRRPRSWVWTISRFARARSMERCSLIWNVISPSTCSLTAQPTPSQTG